MSAVENLRHEMTRDVGPSSPELSVITVADALLELAERLRALEAHITPADRAHRFLEGLTDRACRSGLPNGMGLSAFVDWLRDLYPEYYTRITPNELPKQKEKP